MSACQGHQGRVVLVALGSSLSLGQRTSEPHRGGGLGEPAVLGLGAPATLADRKHKIT